MVLKTYRRQGAFLQGKQIEMPTPEKKAPNIWGKMLDNVSKVTAKLSEQNYALGRAELINGVLETAYNEAPDNPKRFNELIKSGFENGLNGLSDETKNDIYSLANDKVKTLQIKVGNNLNKKLDAENTQKILNLTNEALYGTNGIQQTNSIIAEYLTTGKNINGQPVTKEEMDALISQRNKQAARLKALGQAKNLRGNYIIGDKALRKAIETENYGMNDLILDNISEMSYDNLAEFDDTIFQDKKGFMERSGLTTKEYTAMDNKIKKRRKELNDEDERVINEARDYNIIGAAYQKSPDALEDAKKRLTEDSYKKFEEIVLQPTKKQEMLITNEDVDFLRQFNSIVEVADTQYDGNKNYNEQYLTKVIDAQYAAKKYREKYGSDDKNDEIIDSIIYNSAVDNLYGQTMGLVDSTNLLSQIVKNVDLPAEEERLEEQERQELLGVRGFEYSRDFDFEKDLRRKPASIVTAIKGGKYTDEEIIKRQREIASKAIKQVVQIGTRMRQTQDEGLRQELYDQAETILDRANKDVIGWKVSNIIEPNYLKKLERDLDNGKQAIFRYAGTLYEFKGYTEDDLITADVGTERK